MTRTIRLTALSTGLLLTTVLAACSNSDDSQDAKETRKDQGYEKPADALLPAKEFASDKDFSVKEVKTFTTMDQVRKAYEIQEPSNGEEVDTSPFKFSLDAPMEGKKVNSCRKAIKDYDKIAQKMTNFAGRTVIDKDETRQVNLLIAKNDQADELAALFEKISTDCDEATPKETALIDVARIKKHTTPNVLMTMEATNPGMKIYTAQHEAAGYYVSVVANGKLSDQQMKELDELAVRQAERIEAKG